MSELHIDGQWRAALDGATREIRCPADGTLVATVAEGSEADTEAAIAAARRAFDAGEWSATPAAERGALLLRVADTIERDIEEYSRAESLDTGKRIIESRYDMADIIACFRYFGNIAAQHAGRVVDAGTTDVASRVVHEPVGVCGLITPWNFPLLQVAWKVAPALAAGNTFVLKPSELTPHTAILLLRTLTEVGLPAGVGNLVLGAGAKAGAPLSTHPDVDLVSFTGGLLTGRQIAASAAGTVKKVALELGGKNPNIVFDDADFETAVDFVLTAVFLHSGQVCSAGARLIVQESLHDKLVDEVVRRAEQIQLGGPFDEHTETGPLISAAHREKVAGYVRDAPIAYAGSKPDGPGFWFAPTVLAPIGREHPAVAEEVFGPVVSVLPFEDEDDAVALANNTEYGLSGSIWTRDLGRGIRVSRGVRAGNLAVNSNSAVRYNTPFGGYGQSGIGRELGPDAVEEFTETKNVFISTARD